MSQPYVGEIRMFAGNYAPAGWLFCEGQFLPIAENEALFQLIGTTYGGDGETTFALPDLRGRLPIHMGQGPGLTSRQIGERAGTEAETLTVQQIPTHSHSFLATFDAGTTTAPQNNVLASGPNVDLFFEDAPTANLNAGTLAPIGGSQPHTNFQPYLCVSFIISLFGIFPSPT